MHERDVDTATVRDISAGRSASTHSSTHQTARSAAQQQVWLASPVLMFIHPGCRQRL